MKRKLGLRMGFGLALAGLLLSAQLFLAASMVLAQSEGPTAIVLTADGALTPAMVEYLNRGLQTAAQDNAELII